LYERLNADSIKPERFALVVGNARAGTTIVGAIIDSHPHMICAQESASSMNYWRGQERYQIIEDIVENSRTNLAAGRPSAGYQYAIATDDKEPDAIAVIGDKIWNPAVLLLAGDHALLGRLQDTIGCPLALVHCVRNPFDVVATMHLRSGATLRERLHWFTMHCEAVQILIEREDFPIHTVRNEELIADPSAVSAGLFDWFGYPTSRAHLARIEDKVYREPASSRTRVEWPEALIRAVEEVTARFPFLIGYTFD
jgi:hypothetical protein